MQLRQQIFNQSVGNQMCQSFTWSDVFSCLFDVSEGSDVSTVAAS